MVGRLVVPLLVIGVVILGIVVTASGAETRSQIDYLTRLQADATRVAQGGAALPGVTTRLSTISREEFVTAMDIVVSDLEEALAFGDEEPPTAAVLPVRALYRQAVTAWHQGATALTEAILHAADNPNDNAAVDRLVAALAQLRVGDSVWAQLMAEMERDDVPEPLSPLPEVVMSPASGPLLTVALVYTEAARAETNTLGLRPGLRVSQLVSDPAWQVDSNDQAVVPVTEQVVFSVVMSNVGNVDSIAQELILRLEGGAEPVQAAMTVEPLAPGQQVTLVFDPFTVTPGVTYNITATIGTTAPDIDIEDNTVTLQFRVGDD
jgi:hypothetical protein